MPEIASTLFVRNGTRSTAGFTIVELAVTMVIIAILLGSILIPLNAQVESRKYDETQRSGLRGQTRCVANSDRLVIVSL